jgi:pimeloyl-ACP methyl ester carboxylesterase
VTRFSQVILQCTQQDLERMRGEPPWATRVSGAHILARETAVEEGYRFEPGGFKNVRRPTLLLQGEVSPQFLKTSIQVVHAALPNSRVVVLPGQGHNAMRTASELLSTEVLNFLL